MNAIPSNENESESNFNSDDDSEDQSYKDLLNRSFTDTDDIDDVDFVPGENDDETSDGELSEVSEHLSDDNEPDLVGHLAFKFLML